MHYFYDFYNFLLCKLRFWKMLCGNKGGILLFLDR